MSALTVATRFTAVDMMSPTVRAMAGNFNSMTQSMNAGLARQERLFKRLTPNVGAAAKQMLGFASTGALIAGAAFSGKEIIDYETAIQSLSAVTGVAGDELELFKKDINSLARDTKKSAKDIAGSYEVVGSMMSQYLSDPKALNQITNAGIILAKASRTELVPTLENLTSIMNQFDLKANQATDTINRLTAGEIVGSLRTSQVSEALQEFGAGAYTANVSLAESVALVEALAKQMKVDKIGVGARNILTVLDSAKGLDKRARKDLKKSGVDLAFLMDKTKTLSERLHELSKISNDATKITSVFGKENKTAAQVIFNQLGTFDQYLAKIKTTNEAQNQAATNSKTLGVAIEQLKNTWINFITTSDTSADVLKKASGAMNFISENLETIVKVGLHAVGMFALWKGAIIATNAVMVVYEVSLGLYNALMTQSVVLTKGGALAQATYIGVSKAAVIVLDVLSGNFATLNALMMANPAGLVVGGIVALTAAVYFLNKRNEDLLNTYQKQLDLRVNEAAAQEKAGIDALTQSYLNMGYSIRKATEESLKLKAFQANEKVQTVKSDKARLEAEALENANNNTWNPFFSHSSNREAVDAKNQELTTAMAAQNAVTMAAIRAANAGIVDPKAVNSILNPGQAPAGLSLTPEMDKKVTDSFLPKEKQWTPTSDSKNSEQSNLLSELKAALGSQKVLVEFKNAPAGTTVSTTGSGVQTQNSY